MTDEQLQTLVQYGAGAFVVLIVLIALIALASATDLGRAMLPDAVIKALAKLLPNSWVKDVTVTGPGRFELSVQGAVHLKTVHVRHLGNRTIAWTFDPETNCPQAGTFAITEFDHVIRAGVSLIDPEKVRSRISTALDEILSPKSFLPVGHNQADILIRVVVYVDHGMPIDDLQSSSDDRDNGDWRAAIRTALQHDGVRRPTALAQGSILMSLFDAVSHKALWRAAALGKFVVDVSEHERDQRIRLAVSEMLNSFPPKATQPIQPNR